MEYINPNLQRAVYGQAAVDAGTPDRGQNDDRTDAVDAIANILHWLGLTKPEFDARATVAMACNHYMTEVGE